MNTEEKLKQGCGLEFIGIAYRNRCGQIEDLKHQDSILLCTTCKAKLTQHQEDKKKFKKLIEKIQKKQYNEFVKTTKVKLNNGYKDWAITAEDLKEGVDEL